MNKASQEGRTLDGQHHFDAPEKDLLAKLHETQAEVHQALCDSFDTPKALDLIANLVSAANVYITSRSPVKNTSALEAIAIWVTRILRIFGLGEGSGVSLNGQAEIGWGQLKSESDGSADVSRRFFECHCLSS